VLERARRVRVVLLDVDGVLTDGRIVVGAAGLDVRSFDAKDGLGIQLGRSAGLAIGIVSGRRSAVVEDRARDLGIAEVHQGVKDKAARLSEVATRLGVSLDETCFMGDDLVDLAPMRRAGLAAAPADAVEAVRRAAHYVTVRPGGRGAVRELVELVLAAAGRLEQVLAPFVGDG
jgi:3-deoxy-D-manno-octulosonate 8-phosphate phosphatase (KDO 8-P phosphatase)